MPIPTYQEVMLPLLKLVGQGEIARQDAVQRLIEEFQLTPEEAAQRLPGGQTVIYNRAAGPKLK